ncbi:MAG: hypothetical protein HOE90_20380 [Bacteriovoracaceae bacterium]|jgi:hypothetical protein|nr:hypothetical protein [Bacteriovoracaceae bacterium]
MRKIITPLFFLSLIACNNQPKSPEDIEPLTTDVGGQSKGAAGCEGIKFTSTTDQKKEELKTMLSVGIWKQLECDSGQNQLVSFGSALVLDREAPFSYNTGSVECNGPIFSAPLTRQFPAASKELKGGNISDAIQVDGQDYHIIQFDQSDLGGEYDCMNLAISFQGANLQISESDYDSAKSGQARSTQSAQEFIESSSFSTFGR